MDEHEFKPLKDLKLHLFFENDALKQFYNKALVN